MGSYEEQNEEGLKIIKALDKAIEEGPWQEGLLFQNIGKKLVEIRDRFVELIGLTDTELAQLEPEQASSAKKILVYLSLYQAEGTQINKWLNLLNSINKLTITRPIYQNEADVIAAIRSKAFQLNDAYVEIEIDSTMIENLPESASNIDRSGRPLITVKEGALKPQNIKRFVHASGEYGFKNGILVKLNTSS